MLLLQEVGDRLDKVLALAAQLEAAAISEAPTTESSDASLSSGRLAAGGARTPRMDEVGLGGCWVLGRENSRGGTFWRGRTSPRLGRMPQRGGDQHCSTRCRNAMPKQLGGSLLQEGPQEALSELPPKTEAALRKGFRRQTLAGPPWLDTVAAKHAKVRGHSCTAYISACRCLLGS